MEISTNFRHQILRKGEKQNVVEYLGNVWRDVRDLSRRLDAGAPVQQEPRNLDVAFLRRQQETCGAVLCKVGVSFQAIMRACAFNDSRPVFSCGEERTGTVAPYLPR